MTREKIIKGLEIISQDNNCLYTSKYGVMTVKSVCKWAIEALDQQKEGVWVGIDEEPHEDYECSICGYVCSTFTTNIKPSDEYHYCPNCGAKMKEGD